VTTSTDRDMKPANCQSCRAPITWARTANGKLSPFERDDAGVWVIDHTGTARYVGGGKLRPLRVLELETPRPRYTSHFATCPDATAWRQST